LIIGHHGTAQSLAHGFELVANENAVHILPSFASHLSPLGVVILPLVDAEVTWKILVTWRRGRAAGALKALLDALFAKETPKANGEEQQVRHPDVTRDQVREPALGRRRPVRAVSQKFCSRLTGIQPESDAYHAARRGPAEPICRIR
jgi:hypothetical protein